MKMIIRNCPAYYINTCSDSKVKELYCSNCTDCIMKQIVELCKEQKVINCNIDGKEHVLKAYYHTHLGDKILELLDIQEDNQ